MIRTKHLSPALRIRSHTLKGAMFHLKRDTYFLIKNLFVLMHVKRCTVGQILLLSFITRRANRQLGRNGSTPENHPTNSQAEHGLSHLWPVRGSTPHQSQGRDDRMIKSAEIQRSHPLGHGGRLQTDLSTLTQINQCNASSIRERTQNEADCLN